MPLTQSGSESAFEHNLKAELNAGKPKAQSLAIAYETQRANDVEVVSLPDSISLKTINEENCKFWATGGRTGASPNPEVTGDGY